VQLPDREDPEDRGDNRDGQAASNVVRASDPTGVSALVGTMGGADVASRHGGADAGTAYRRFTVPA
jgi:hypothetical protein